jgi:hypothetical protein
MKVRLQRPQFIFSKCYALPQAYPGNSVEFQLCVQIPPPPPPHPPSTIQPQAWTTISLIFSLKETVSGDVLGTFLLAYLDLIHNKCRG